MRIGILSDDFSRFNTTVDTTFALTLAAYNLGYKIWQFEPTEILAKSGQVSAKARNITNLIDRKEKFFEIAKTEIINLSTDIDIILIRQDPPFDIQYISICMLLESISSKTVVLNDPLSVRNCPEKLLPYIMFSEIMPRSEIAFDSLSLITAINNFNKCVVKPMFGNGGEGIIVTDKSDKNLSSLSEMYFRLYPREPLLVQDYLTEVSLGDKRVILIDGEAVGALNRVPLASEHRANLHAGASGIVVELSKSDRKIVETIKPYLKENNLFFVGIDIIGDKLTEVNVTSPTGIREIHSQSGNDIATLFWKKVNEKFDVNKE